MLLQVSNAPQQEQQSTDAKEIPMSEHGEYIQTPTNFIQSNSNSEIKPSEKATSQMPGRGENQQSVADGDQDDEDLEILNNDH